MTIRGLGPSSFSGSIVGLDGTQSLRRASSIRRNFNTGTAAIKRKSACLQTKFAVDGLVETLRRTKLRFVQCLLPQHNAGLCESSTSLFTMKSANGVEDSVMNVPLLRSQVRIIKYWINNNNNICCKNDQEGRSRHQILLLDGDIWEHYSYLYPKITTINYIFLYLYERFNMYFQAFNVEMGNIYKCITDFIEYHLRKLTIAFQTDIQSCFVLYVKGG